MRHRQAWVLALLLAALPSELRADEGQWMPEQLQALEPRLDRAGLRLASPLLWSEKGGLLRAAVHLSKCSASFVSKQGLIATNHHCAYGDLQSVSSVEHDYLTEGFLAQTKEQELSAPGQRVEVMLAITDVTAAVLGATQAESDPHARALAERRVRQTLVEQCEAKRPGLRCEVERFFEGAAYRQFETLELRDVRLVYAPPAAMGEYGGEVDNWMWPRHTADFSLLRAYVGPDGQPADPAPENVPYSPEHWLEVNPDGVAPGDFVAVLGYPGHTDRYLPLPEVERQLEQVLPSKITIYEAWLQRLQSLASTDPEIRIKVAAKSKSLANRLKNARGMEAGITRLGILAERRQEHGKLLESATAEEKSVLDGLATLSQARRAVFARDFLLDNVERGPDSLAIAVSLIRRARERAKPDTAREPRYTERNADDLWATIERHLRDFDPRVDAALFELWAAQERDLGHQQSFWPERSRVTPAILERTPFASKADVRKLFDEADPASLTSGRDALTTLALAVAQAQETSERQQLEFEGRALALGPPYFDMLEKARPGLLYPDANGTLRMSYANVRGYTPQDGLWALPQTTLAGQIAKHTGQPPFAMPPNVLAAAKQTDRGRWKDAKLGDVPVCFLSSADTTGGNSGSAVIDAYGRLVGLNFDRVWENVAGDFGYDIARSRNISVDVRYLLWMLDRVEHADALLRELGADKPAQDDAKTAETPAQAETPPPIPEEEKSRSRCRIGESAPMPPLLFMLLFLVPPRRRVIP